MQWAVVLAQLVDSTVASNVRGPEVQIQSSATFIEIFIYCYLFVEKTKIKKKRLEMAHLKQI